MTDLELADEAAGQLCHAYGLLGMPAFMIRCTADGNTCVIAQQLPPETVAKMLHAAADASLAQAPQVTRN